MHFSREFGWSLHIVFCISTLIIYLPAPVHLLDLVDV